LLGFPALCAVHCTDTAATDNPSQTGLETGVKEAGPDATESHGNSNETSIPALTSTGAPHNNQVEGGPPDTPPLGERDAGDGATPTSLGDGGIHVGDRIDGEEVVHVYDYGNDCVEVTLRAAPRFACTAQQLATLDAALIEPSEPEYGADTPDLAVSTCGDLASLRRSALTQSLNARLERSYVSRLNAYCAPQSHYAHFDSDGQVSTCAQFVDAGAPASPDPNGSETASEYSTTNTQVEDVDEADWVKNDGGTIYVLNDSQLLVFDAWPVEEMTELARVELRSEPRRMFLDGERLVVYLREGVTDAEENCTYGYDCRSASEGGSTAVQVYDVSEPASPLLLKEYQFSGAYLASRRIGSSVYSVLHDQGAPEPVDADLKLSANDPDALDAEFEQKTQALNVLLEELPSEYFLPQAIERVPGAADTAVATCDEVVLSEASRGNSFVSIFGFDLEQLSTPRRTVVGSKPGFVYASPEALYLAVDGIDGLDDGFSSRYTGQAKTEQSTIHKFALAEGRASYAGTGVVPGHVLNQFSMDEYASVLRVATSSGWVPDPDTASNVVTLGERDGEFQVLGELTGLAPTEDIRSVRFDQGRGFVVTFKKTDPLFVIGLDEPTNPKLLGELKIPGFSTYMHLLDSNHLLAVGFDADDHGDFAYFDGIQVQIFDVTDLEHPALQHKALLGTRGSGSEALMDHLAFNYFPSRGVLALPATICAGGNDGQFGEFEFSGLVVFDVSVENGIAERGRLPFVTPQDVEQRGTPACSTWWSDSTSLVKRSIFMEDYAIGLSDQWLKAAALDQLGTVLQSLPLSDGDSFEEE
jgi:hypothetical protein